MSSDDFQALKSKLDAFSRGHDTRGREFKKRGGFSDTQTPIAEGIRNRQKAIKAKLDAAIRKGAVWDTIKYEFERDFNALSEVLLRWEDRLDADAVEQENRTT